MVEDQVVIGSSGYRKDSVFCYKALEKQRNATHIRNVPHIWTLNGLNMSQQDWAK